MYTLRERPGPRLHSILTLSILLMGGIFVFPSTPFYGVKVANLGPTASHTTALVTKISPQSTSEPRPASVGTTIPAHARNLSEVSPSGKAVIPETHSSTNSPVRVLVQPAPDPARPSFTQNITEPPLSPSQNQSGNLGTPRHAKISLSIHPLVCGSLEVSASPVGDFVGQPVTFSASGCTLPTGDYWYWGNLPGGCTSQDAAQFSCTPTQSGQFHVYGDILCTCGGEEASATDWITVYSDLAMTTGATQVTVGVVYNLSSLPTSDTINQQTNGGIFYWYTWAGLPSGCTYGSGSGSGGDPGDSWTDCSSATSGTYTADLYVDYSNGNAIESTFTFTVNPLPSVSLSMASERDSGQALSFVATPIGGTSPYQYLWFVNSEDGSLDQYFNSCPSAISGPSGEVPPYTTIDKVACTASSPGTYTVHAWVMDADGKTAGTYGMLTVSPDPTISVITSSRSTVDVNQAVWFNATVSGGYGVITYTWSNLPSSGCAGTTTDSVKCTVQTTGTFSPTLTVTDSNDVTSPAVTAPSVGAFSDPVVTSIIPSRTAADENQVVWFNATVTGGYPGLNGYTFTWSHLPTGCPSVQQETVPSVKCTPTTSGTFTPTVLVVDSNNYAVTATGTTSLTLSTDPSITGITIGPRENYDIGQVAWYNATESGGSGGFTYSWRYTYNNQPPPSAYCTGLTTSSVKCTQTILGGEIPEVSVTDSNGYTSQWAYSTEFAYAQVNVWSDPTVSISASRTSADEGQIFWINATVNGGYGGPFTNWSGFNYTWSGLPSMGCQGAKNSTSGNQYYERCDISVATTLSPTLSVVDWNNFGSPMTTAPLVNVLSDPLAPSPSSTNPTADIGTVVTFIANPYGGTGIYSYSWAGLPTGTGCASVNSSTVSCTPTQQTVSYVAVTVKDSNGYTVTSAPTRFVVTSAPIVSLQVNRSQLDMHETLLLYANASGGTGIYTYTYLGLPSGCSTANSSRLPCTPTATGTFTVTVFANDTGGGSANHSVAFIVYTDPAITSYWFPVGGRVAYANESLALEINFTGGIAPYSNCIDAPPAWPAGCVNGLGGSSLLLPDYQPYSTAGTYMVVTNITDSTGWVSTLRFNESVYWPLNVSIPVIPLVHQGTQANVTFTLFQNHGAPPMEWWLNDSTRGMSLCGPVAVPSYGTQSCSFVPNWNGTDTLNLTVRDGLHSRLFVPFSYQVVSDLGSLTLSAQAGSYSAVQGGTLQDEVGATTTFIASYVGGSSPYTCTLTQNGSGTIALWSSSTSSCSTTYTWTHVGTYTLDLTVKDSFGGVGGTARQWLIVDVTAPVSVTSIAPAQTNLDAQVIDNISAKTTGGLTPYSFVWDFGNGATKTTNQPWVTYAWPSPGTFTVKVTITDGAGASSTLSTSVQVIADPAVKVMSMVDGPISTSGITSGGSTTLPSGTTASFNLTFSGGTRPYSVVWKLNGTTVNSTAIFNLWTNFSLSWPSVGNHSLSVTISDSEGQVSTFTLSVKVIVDMVGPVTLTISRSVVDSGMWDNATASATGGWAPFTYDWLISAVSGNRWINGSVNALDATWTTSGSYSITTMVTDAFGYRASETTKLTVNAVPTAPCAPQIVSGIPMAGNALTFSLNCVSGGTGPLSYSWGLGANHQVTTAPQATVIFHQAASYEISVNVTDALGEMADSKVLTLGTIPPSIDNATYEQVSLSHNTTSNGTAYHLELEFVLQTSDTDGSVTGYRYSTNESNLSSLPWIPLSERVANLTLTGSAIQQLFIQVIDNYNRTSSPYTLVLNLTTPPSGKGPTGSSGQGTDWGFTFLLVVVAMVVAFAAILAFVELRKRRRSGGGPAMTTANSSDSGVAKAIEDHLKQNPNEEEAALVHQVTSMTGATDATVRTQLSILSETHKIEKSENGGTTRYTNAGGEVSREELARMGMITDTMLSTIRSETPVTGRRLKEVLKPYNLGEGEIRNYLLDMRTEIAWDPGADFGDFDSVVFRAMPSTPPTPRVEVEVDESALPKFLNKDAPTQPLGSKRHGKRSPVA